MGLARLRQRAHGDAARGAEAVRGCLVVAVRAFDRRPDLLLVRLFAQPEVDQTAQPDEACDREDGRDSERPPLVQVDRGHVGGDEGGRGDGHGDCRPAERAERVPVAKRAAVAEPERGADGRGDAGGERRERDAKGQEACDPEPGVPGRLEAEVEKVGGVRDRLGADEGGGAARAERDAVERVVELPVGEQRERAGDHDDERDARQDDPEPDQVVGLARPGQQRRLAFDVPRDEPEHDAAGEAPEDRDRDHRERLVLVDVHVQHVEDEEERHRDRGDDEREREEVEEAEDDDEDDRPGERGAEGPHVRARQVREDGRDEVRVPPALMRGGRVFAARAPPR